MSDQDIEDLREALQQWEDSEISITDLAEIATDAGFGCLSEIADRYIMAHGRVMARADHIDLDPLESALISEIEGLIKAAGQQN